MNDIKEVDKIIFGIMSHEEIISRSVCNITTTKLMGPGSVYDERMGVLLGDNNTVCITCLNSAKFCYGHASSILLNEPIIHPSFYRNVVNYLRAFCVKCNRLIVTKDQLDIDNLLVYKGQTRFDKIIDKIDKIDICGYCSIIQPKIYYSPTDNSISRIYKSLEKSKDKKKNNIYVPISIREIKKIFDGVLDEDIVLLGYDPSRIRPRNLIMTAFPVLPICSRPPVVADGMVCDDDLTNQLIEIVKANNILGEERNPSDEKLELRRNKALQSLKFRISTFYNNSSGKSRHPTTNRPIKGLKERLTGRVLPAIDECQSML